MNIQISKSNFTGAQLIALIQLSAFCLIIIIAQQIRTTSSGYYFLAWNLFLAWVPLIIAKIWYHRLKIKPLRHWKSLGMYGLWLLFFPNSPYLITDLMHLNNRLNASIWTDTLLLFSCALAGLLVGIYSLHVVHKILDSFFSRTLAWSMIIGSIALSGFGIYLGRILRWNSWDLFTNPLALIADTAAHLFNPMAIKMTLGYSILICLVYYILNSLVRYEKSKK